MRNLLFILGLAFTLGCSRDSDTISKERTEPCGEAVQVNAKSFSTVTSDPFTITEASIKGDCLTVTLGLGSACIDPDVDLLHAVSDAAVNPTLHRLKIIKFPASGCAMPGKRTMKFDLYPLRKISDKKISIQLDGYDKQLEYAY